VCQLHHADTDCLALLFGIFSTRFFRVRFGLEWSGQRSELTFDVGVEKPAITCFGHLKFIARFAIGGVNQRKSICFKSRYGTQHLYFVCKYARACSGVLNSPVHSNGSPLPISQTTISGREGWSRVTNMHSGNSCNVVEECRACSPRHLVDRQPHFRNQANILRPLDRGNQKRERDHPDFSRKSILPEIDSKKGTSRTHCYRLTFESAKESCLVFL
jgi:hypothetical protein